MSLEKNMPKELVITRPAYNDMQHIFEYIAKDNKIAASKLLNLFEEKFDNIMNFPNIGYKPKFLSKNIRVCIVAKHYQIVYTVSNEKLYIQRILTEYQDIFNI